MTERERERERLTPRHPPRAPCQHRHGACCAPDGPAICPSSPALTAHVVAMPPPPPTRSSPSPPATTQQTNTTTRCRTHHVNTVIVRVKRPVGQPYASPVAHRPPSSPPSQRRSLHEHDDDDALTTRYGGNTCAARTMSSTHGTSTRRNALTKNDVDPRGGGRHRDPVAAKRIQQSLIGALCAPVGRNLALRAARSNQPPQMYLQAVKCVSAAGRGLSVAG